MQCDKPTWLMRGRLQTHSTACKGALWRCFYSSRWSLCSHTSHHSPSVWLVSFPYLSFSPSRLWKLLLHIHLNVNTWLQSSVAERWNGTLRRSINNLRVMRRLPCQITFKRHWLLNSRVCPRTQIRLLMLLILGMDCCVVKPLSAEREYISIQPINAVGARGKMSL